MLLKIEKTIEDLISNKLINRNQIESNLERKLLDPTSVIVKKIEKAYLRRIPTNILAVNGKYLTQKLSIGDKFICMPECVSISRYSDYLESLYNDCLDIDKICMSYDEKVITDVASSIEKIYFEPCSIYISSCSKEGLNLSIKIKDNLITEHLKRSVSKVGVGNVARIFRNIDVSDLAFEGMFAIERRDIKVNQFNTAIY